MRQIKQSLFRYGNKRMLSIGKIHKLIPKKEMRCQMLEMKPSIPAWHLHVAHTPWHRP